MLFRERVIENKEREEERKKGRIWIRVDKK